MTESSLAAPETPAQTPITALRDKGADGGLPLRISPPWTWSALIVIGMAVLAALVLSWLGHVEVTGRARGIVRPVSGVRALVAQTGGIVSDVLIRSGDHVMGGMTVVRLRAADVEASVLESTRNLAIREEELRSVRAENGHSDQRAALLDRLRIARMQIASLEQSVSRQKAHIATVEQLRASGLMSGMQVDDAHDQYDQAVRALGAGRDAEKRTIQELSAVDEAYVRALRDADSRLGEAQARRESFDLPAQKDPTNAPAPGPTTCLVVLPHHLRQAD